MEFSFLFFYSLFGCLLGFFFAPFFAPFFFLFFADAGSASEAIHHKNHIGIANISDIIKVIKRTMAKSGPELNKSVWKTDPPENDRYSTNIKFRTVTITKYAFK